MDAKHSDGLYVVFDGPPSHESGRFIELEDVEGHGVGDVAEWVDRSDGYWTLGPFYTATGALTDRERAALHLVAKERSVDRSGAAWEEPLLRNFTEEEWGALATKLAVRESA